MPRTGPLTLDYREDTVMYRKLLILTCILLVGVALMSGCGNLPQPEGSLTVSDLLAGPIYEVEAKVYGQVSLLGELFCPCFELTSGGEALNVWYDLMVAEDGTVQPAASADGIENGDWVVVTGELQKPETPTAHLQFWASEIAIQE
jgi:hypothetical protein